MALTTQGLADSGHEVCVVAPAPEGGMSGAEVPAGIVAHAVAVSRPSWPAAAAKALLQRRALSVARHHSVEMEEAVRRAVESFRPDIVHAEQLQAFANCAPARSAGVPVVLRAQNVESDLWRQIARAKRLAAPLTLEARRLRADETRALASASRTVALTPNDATTFRGLDASAEPERIVAVAPAFPRELPAGSPREGAPAIVLVGSTGWWPNQQAMRWFMREVMPRLSRRLPRAVVHVFGGDAGPSAPNLRWHGAPADSTDAFPENAIVAVPLFVGSGIRMRILEAWARGVPVVATSNAARGLDIAPGRELSIADTPDDFSASLSDLAENAEARRARIAAGRDYLARRHDPVCATEALLDVYRQAIAEQCARRDDDALAVQANP
jgi:hypothetical protein